MVASRLCDRVAPLFHRPAARIGSADILLKDDLLAQGNADDLVRQHKDPLGADLEPTDTPHDCRSLVGLKL